MSLITFRNEKYGGKDKIICIAVGCGLWKVQHIEGQETLNSFLG